MVDAGARAQRRLMVVRKARCRGKEPLRPPVLGLDIGGVIVDYAETTSGATLNGAEWLVSSVVPVAMEGIATVVDQRFHENVYLVSKAGPKMESRTRVWLEHIDFFD